MIIREMAFDDIAQVAEIERENSLTPWDENGLLTYLLRNDTLFLVAADAFEGGETADDPDYVEPHIYGYVGLLMVPWEADITNITVREEARNQGIGRRLLDEIIRRCPEHGVSVIHLEVRESGEAARHLYEKIGFKTDGIRKGYYTSPTEDAVLMTLDLSV
ncbi:MAG: ribosomal protein S18-alanine N-acetyltransferase [Lachnospiraceae bacterium]|nr:ribosomal protein S18-alanine N-acetyltransferase [Lachnospiraceae bacterium]